MKYRVTCDSLSKSDGSVVEIPPLKGQGVKEFNIGSLFDKEGDREWSEIPLDEPPGVHLNEGAHS